MHQLVEMLMTWMFAHVDVLLRLVLRIWNAIDENKKAPVLLSRYQELVVS